MLYLALEQLKYCPISPKVDIEHLKDCLIFSKVNTKPCYSIKVSFLLFLKIFLISYCETLHFQLTQPWK